MLSTRVKTGVVGYDGINLYTSEGIYIGEIKVTKSNRYGAELSCDIPSIVIKPKARDEGDSYHNPFIEGHD